MTEEEMKEHIELQSATIAEQKSAIATQKDELGKLTGSVTELKKTSVSPEDITKFKEFETKNVELEKKNAEFQSQFDNATLKEKFPAIKDWSLVKGKDLAEKEEHAGKLNEALGGKAPEKKPDPDPNKEPADKGEKFKGVGGPGAPSAESIAQEEKTKKLEVLKTAQKSGDLAQVLDSCFDLQPEKTAAVGLALTKK